MKPFTRWIWYSIGLVLLVSGFAGLWLSNQDFHAWKQLMDPLAKDGSLQLLTPALHGQLVNLTRWGGLGCLLLAALMFIQRTRSLVLLESILRFPGWFIRTFWADLCSLFRNFRPGWQVFGTAAALTLVVFLIRLPFMEMPMRHDEAFSITYFSAAPLRFTLEDYSIPNNHVFHNVLVNLIYHNLGKVPWMMRLPTFLAGLLTVPAAFALSRRWYGLKTAVLAGALVGVTPVLIDYGANARGYSLVTLLTLVCMGLGYYLKDNRNLAGWLMLSLAGALGFFTIPTMLYPVGILYTWLFLSLLSGDIGKEYGTAKFIRYLAGSGIGMGVLALLFYTPLLLRSGWDALFHNYYVASLSWPDFWAHLLTNLGATWREWNWNVSPILTALVLTGVILSCLFHRRLTRQRIALQLAVPVLLIPMLLIQRPNPLARIWIFLLPLVLIWASAGTLGLAALWLENKSRSALLRGITVCIASLLMLSGLLRTAQICPGWVYPTGDVENTAKYIQAHLQPTDVVIILPIEDTMMWYYSELYGFHNRLGRDKLFFRAYALVNPLEYQTLESVMEARGPDLVFLNFNTTQKVAQFGVIELYTVDANRDLVIEAYQQLQDQQK